ncbi:Na+/H+ antiporter NhaA [Endozoicomonas gorgoniicola]|uniref:Na(+)/H(+) antiporter NhaA n=1 Tax=Endozoicomonas gorgoniicola TaxID=1234144 RepID=A0ABT3N462_9GAMM|nr:Na+/H+ antiporter NhaA [Endozoicomonas gorgoniicola]MCW7556429.1 Na+/H+ antiporter NhaA [Endozoicomonas gorgoniicola]
MHLRRLHHFLRQDYAVGVLLIVAAILAKIAVNSPLADYYNLLLQLPVNFSIGSLEINKPLLLWINDGLMAVFFLLIGLEVKYEIIRGDLSTPAQIALPGVAAIGGMVIPALVYTIFNYKDPLAMQGWAIPAATDIAFAVGVLALLGKRVPTSLKTFLLALAIFDDLGAIVIIALFYTSEMSVASMILGSIFLATLVIMNRMNVAKTGPYLFVGALLWICVLKSGVHATLAGVLLAFTIPLNLRDRKGRSPLKALQHKLHSPVNYVILPIFAFANAGIELSLPQLQSLFTPIPLGIMMGLFAGKQLGVFTFCYVAIKAGIAKMPPGANWTQLYGLSILCGIGFTMSLFIGSLAFEKLGIDYLATDRIGILAGSFLSAIVGYCVLKYSSRQVEP